VSGLWACGQANSSAQWKQTQQQPTILQSFIFLINSILYLTNYCCDICLSSISSLLSYWAGPRKKEEEMKSVCCCPHSFLSAACLSSFQSKNERRKQPRQEREKKRSKQQ